MQHNLAELEKDLAASLAAKQEAEEARKRYLQACSDLVQAQVDCYRLFCLWMSGSEQVTPFHPLVQEWRELKGEWEQQLATTQSVLRSENSRKPTRLSCRRQQMRRKTSR